MCVGSLHARWKSSGPQAEDLIESPHVIHGDVIRYCARTAVNYLRVVRKQSSTCSGRFRRLWATRARRQSAPPRGVCATYGEALLLAISQPLSYGKMVPPATPYDKTIPPQGSYISKIGERAEVRWRSSRGAWFHHRVSQGHLLP